MAEEDVHQWRSRPIFISSTFRDMQTERDCLRNFVFPRLEEELRKRRHHLEWVDLRQGVESGPSSTEEQRELLVLKVCLEEIKRSRPFLLVLLGDRYGWVPSTERMEVATRELGFQGGTGFISVTALEIEFGIFKESREQPHRCFFYLREPLPYDIMPQELRAAYSEEFATDELAAPRRTALAALKRRLRDDPEIRPRLRTYQAGWDAQKKSLTGLEDWANRVFDDLWHELDDETRAFAAAPEPPWEKVERDALVEFVEQRSRDFTGRAPALQQLLTLARSPAAEGATWGACVTGPSGSGKSALFAHVVKQLQADPSLLVLANAAGTSRRSGNVDAMLRRWIAELAAFLGVSDALPAGAGVDEVDQAFGLFLGRASMKHRVVLMLDALNEFESTPRARYITWRPKLWPPNARLIATALPGAEAEDLSQRAGVERIKLPPLTAADAREIGRAVWNRHHCPWGEAAWESLAAKKLADGGFAVSSPLWTTLACEQLSLLDADDFARAEREFTGDPLARLAQLRRDLAERAPPDVPGLYAWLLTQTEKVHGEVPARAFAVAIALSRHGWRESDFYGLVRRLGSLLFPDLPACDLTPLQLAGLRRSFRAHIAIRGEMQQIDFFHAQAREAVSRKLQAGAADVPTLHTAIADHLYALPAEDPLRQTELMFHLIRAADPIRAARYYGGGLSGGELAGATDVLAQCLLNQEGPETQSGPHPIISWLGQKQLARTTKLMICHQFLAQLQTALVQRGASASIRLTLIRAVQSTLPELKALGRIGMEAELWAGQVSVGDLMLAKGEMREAEKAYRKALKTSEGMARLNPISQLVQNKVAVSRERLGEVYRARGNLRQALRAQHDAVEIFDRLLGCDPSNADLQHSLASCRSRIGALLLAAEKTDEALREFRECLRAAERLVAGNPDNLSWRRELMASHGQIGGALLSGGDAVNALKAHQEALSVADYLIRHDPTNGEFIAGLALGHANVGKTLQIMGDLPQALHSFNQAVRLFEPLAGQNKSDAPLQDDLAHLYFDVASCQDQAGEHERARDYRARFNAVVNGMRDAGMPLNDELLRLMHEGGRLSAPGSGPAPADSGRKWWRFWS